MLSTNNTLAILYLTLLLTCVTGCLDSQQTSSHLEEQEFEDFIKKDKEVYKEKIAKTKTSIEKQNAYDEFTDSIQEKFQSVTQNTKGDVKKTLEIVTDFQADMIKSTKEWQKAASSVQHPDILNLNLLDSNKAFEHRKDIINNYIQKTKEHKEKVANIGIEVSKRLSVVKGDMKEYNEANLKKSLEKHRQKYAFCNTFFNAHIEYGNTLIEILDTLQQNKEKWLIKNEELVIIDDALLSQFQELLQKHLNSANKINELEKQFIDLM